MLAHSWLRTSLQGLNREYLLHQFPSKSGFSLWCHRPVCMACRLAWVVGFTMGPFPGNERTWKPFNPILGETFELDLPESGVRFVAEQVCTAAWQQHASLAISQGASFRESMPRLHLLHCWHHSTAACVLWHNAAAGAGCPAAIPDQASRSLLLMAGKMPPVHCIDLPHLRMLTMQSLGLQSADGHC